MPIKKLSNETIEQISAGEVITDSIHIIKELLENAIDAYSRNIRIEIKNKKNLIITDDGEGIQKEDFKLLCERYCTSKLNRADEMNKISTFGFRGEALSSISLLSKTTVKSRYKDCLKAYSATYNLNKLKNLEIINMKYGTEIHINDIFFNCENRNILEFNKNKIFKLLVAFQAIHLNLKFTLIFNNQSVPIIKKDNIADILIKNYNLNCKLHEIKMHNFNAFFSPTTISFQKIIFICFINKRLVQQNTLRKKIKDLYSQYLMKNKFPFVFLNIILDKNNVDVNVHPSKDDVIFLNEELILSEIISNMKFELEILDNKNFTYNNENIKTSNENKSNSNFKVYENVKLSLDYYSRDNKEIQKNKSKKNYDFHSLTELKKENKKIEEKLNFIYIGKFNSEIILYQKDNMLYESIYEKLYEDIFYEILLNHFGNYPYLDVEYNLNTKIENKNMLLMLHEYFNIFIDENKILKIPVFFNIIFTEYDINLIVENIFILNLLDEKESFFNILKILSSYYARKVYAHEKILNDCINFGIRITDKIYNNFKPIIGGEELFRLFKR